jgi:hypothetical protein
MRGCIYSYSQPFKRAIGQGGAAGIMSVKYVHEFRVFLRQILILICFSGVALARSSYFDKLNTFWHFIDFDSRVQVAQFLDKLNIWTFLDLELLLNL